MPYNKDWTKPKYPVTAQIINDVGALIEDLIKNNGDEWVGKIGHDILPMLGKDESWYGTVWEALRIYIEKSNIGYSKAGRNGGRYYKLNSSEKATPATIEPNYKVQLQQIKLLIDTVDIDNLSDAQSENLINIIDKILL